MNPVIENEGHDAGSRDSNPKSGNFAVVFDVVALGRRAQFRDKLLRNSLCHERSRVRTVSVPNAQMWHSVTLGVR